MTESQMDRLKKILAKHQVTAFDVNAMTDKIYSLRISEDLNVDMETEIRNEFATEFNFMFGLLRPELIKPAQPPLPGMESLVSHPSHYNSGKIEVIEAIEDWNLSFHRGNAVKYVARAGRKDATKECEDLEKAVWYLERDIELLKAREANREPVRPNDMNPRIVNIPVPPTFFEGEWCITDAGGLIFDPDESADILSLLGEAGRGKIRVVLS